MLLRRYLSACIESQGTWHVVCGPILRGIWHRMTKLSCQEDKIEGLTRPRQQAA